MGKRAMACVGVVFFLVVIMGLSACGSIPHDSRTSEGNEAGETPEATEKSFGADTFDDIVVLGVQTKEPLTDMIDFSTLIVVGEVLELADPFLIKSVIGEEATIGNNVLIEVKAVYRGDETKVGQTIVMRRMGGVFEGITHYYDDEPLVEVGRNYLLFLHEDIASPYRTPDEHYRATMSRASVRFMSDIDEFNIGPLSLSESEFRQAMDRYNEAYPADEYAMYRRSLENMKSNVESGVITQEAYDAQVELFELILDQRATIVTDPDEIAAFVEKNEGISMMAMS